MPTSVNIKTLIDGWVEVAKKADLDAHIDNPIAAHAATAISYDDTLSGLSAATVQAAIDALDVVVDAHIADDLIHFPEPADDGITYGREFELWNPVVTVDVVFPSDDLVLLSDGSRGAKASVVAIDMDGNVNNIETISYNTDITPHPDWEEGLTFYDENDKCLVVYNEEEHVTQQIGREIFIRAYNDGPAIIGDGKPVSVATVDVDGWPHVVLTDASDKFNALAYIGITTHEIGVASFGYVTIAGAVRGLDTSLLIANAPLWADPDVVGGFIQFPPPSPAWEVRVGGVSKSDLTEGIIYSRPRVFSNTQTAFQLNNGSILQPSNVIVSSDGATATCEIQHIDTVSDLSLMFNSEYVTPTAPYIVTLTPGTDEVPQRNWVYFPESTNLLTLSLTGYPTTEQYVPVADILVQSVLDAQADGFRKVHAWTDHLADATGQGHLSHINTWIRNRPAAWVSGVVFTPSVAEGVSAALIDFSYTSGEVFQLHEHIFDEFDSVTENFHVINDFTTPYFELSNLNSTDLDADATGASLANKYYSVVLWGVVSEDLKDCQIYLNLPTGFYTTASGAIADVNATTTYSIPTEYLGTGFLITRLVLRNQAANIQIISGGTFDLRGSVPSAVGGGISGGSGVTLWSQLLDTPNAWTGFAGYGTKVNAGETGLEFVEYSLLGHTHTHASTTGQTADDHHAESHTHDGVDGSGLVDYSSLTNPPSIPAAQTFLHADLTDVGSLPDAHHAKSHTHDGVDGSGVVDYSDLTGTPSIPTNADYVDLTTNQTAAGEKTWSNNAIFNARVGIGEPAPLTDLSILSTQTDNNLGSVEVEVPFLEDNYQIIYGMWHSDNRDENVVGIGLKTYGALDDTKSGIFLTGANDEPNIGFVMDWDNSIGMGGNLEPTNYPALVNIGKVGTSSSIDNGILGIWAHQTKEAVLYLGSGVDTTTPLKMAFDGFNLTFDNRNGEQMRLNDAGNLGLNVTSPQATLHIDGTVRLINLPAVAGVTGELYDNGDGILRVSP